jgi:hypothetical protein
MPRLDEPYAHEYNENLIEYWIYARDTSEYWEFRWDWKTIHLNTTTEASVETEAPPLALL